MPGKDALGQPTFSDSDPVNLAVDLTSAAAAVRNGVVRRGTQAERLAVTPVYAGLEWEQTDGTQPGRWRHNGTGWEWKGTAAWGTFYGAAPESGAWTVSVAPAGVAPIIQTGRYKSFSSENAFGNAYFPALNFPSPFPGGVTSLHITPIVDRSGEVPERRIVIDRLTPTNFRPYIPGENNVARATFFWLAVGY